MSGRVEATRRTTLPVDVRTLEAYHESPVAFERLAPPWHDVQLVERTGGLEPGARTRFRGRAGPIRFIWDAEHVEHAGPGFTDVMRRGPLAQWRHEHLFEPRPDGTVLTDRIEAKIRGPYVPASITARVARDVDAMLRYRHEVTRDDLADPHPGRALRIAITGSSGLIGTRLRLRLLARGHRVVRLVRSAPVSPDAVRWNPSGPWDASPLDGFDAVVHLAGENLGARLRWTRDARERILRSRVQGTGSVASALSRLERPPALVSASAVGVYGDGGEALLDERAPAGGGFLAGVCVAWEGATEPARAAGIRVVHPRFGIVLAARSGAIRPLILLASLGLLGAIGTGRQRMPWISLHDCARALEHLVTSTLDGPVNLAVPETPTQRELFEVLARLKGRRLFMSAPASLVTTALGAQGRELLLFGQRVAHSRLTDDGFAWTHPSVESALAADLGL